jgi:hypothetical protein
LRGEIKEQGEGDAGTSEKAMQGHRVSSSLRELDAVALATNSTISMKRGTKEADRVERSQDE